MKAASNQHQTRTKLAPKLHQTGIKVAPNWHQTSTKLAPQGCKFGANLHQTCTKLAPPLCFFKKNIRKFQKKIYLSFVAMIMYAKMFFFKYIYHFWQWLCMQKWTPFSWLNPRVSQQLMSASHVSLKLAPNWHQHAKHNFLIHIKKYFIS